MDNSNKLADELLWHVEQVCGPLNREACVVEGDDDYSILRGNFLAALRQPTPEASSPIMLEIAAADDEARKWERRWKALAEMYPIERIFADRDGRWGLRDFLDYAGQVCGFDATKGADHG